MNKITPLKKSSKIKDSSPRKGEESQNKKVAEDLWKAYFKNPLENTVLSKEIKKTVKTSGKLNENIRRLK
jgi:hypothetical protein